VTLILVECAGWLVGAGCVDRVLDGGMLRCEGVYKGSSEGLGV
jgi:hypothetical protein